MMTNNEQSSGPIPLTGAYSGKEKSLKMMEKRCFFEKGGVSKKVIYLFIYLYNFFLIHLSLLYNSLIKSINHYIIYYKLYKNSYIKYYKLYKNRDKLYKNSYIISYKLYKNYGYFFYNFIGVI